MTTTIGIIFLIASIYLPVIYIRHKRKCNNCGRVNALQTKNILSSREVWHNEMVTTAKWQDKNGTYRSKKELRPVRYIIDKKLLVCKYCKSEKAKEFKRGSSIENAGMTNATIFFLVCAFIGGYIIKSTYEINQNETTTPSYQTPVTNSENTNEGNKVSVQQIDTSTNIASLSSKQDTVNSKTDTSLVIMTTPNGDNTQDTLEKSDSSNLIEEDISNKTSLNIAVQLLKKGKSIKEVADSTGLSVDEVMFIKKHF